MEVSETDRISVLNLLRFFSILKTKVPKLYLNERGSKNGSTSVLVRLWKYNLCLLTSDLCLTLNFGECKTPRLNRLLPESPTLNLNTSSFKLDLVNLDDINCYCINIITLKGGRGGNKKETNIETTPVPTYIFRCLLGLKEKVNVIG